MTMDVEASQLSCGLLSSLNFEKIDTEILADKVKEQEETKADIVEKDAIGKEISRGKDADESTAPPSQYMHTLYFFYIIQKNWLPLVLGFWGFSFSFCSYFLENNGCPLVLGLQTSHLFALLPPGFEASVQTNFSLLASCFAHATI